MRATTIWIGIAIALCIGHPLHAQGDWVHCDGPYGGMVREIALTTDGRIHAMAGGTVYRFDHGQQRWIGDLEFQEQHAQLRRYFASNTEGDLYVTNGLQIWVWKTGQNSWERIPYEGSLSMLACSSDILYAGTSRNGVLRSTDEGDTWEELGPQFARITALNADGVLLAAASNAVYLWDTDGWSDVSSKLSLPGTVTRIARSPDGMIYALMSETSQWGNMLRTEDGLDWIRCGPPDQKIEVLAPGTDGQIYASTGTELFESTDYGVTWALQDSSHSTIDLILTTGGELFRGDYRGVYRSGNSGADWIAIHTGIRNVSVRTLLNGTSGGLLAASTLQGFFSSSDNGLTWDSAIPSYPSAQIAFVSRPAPGHLFAATSFSLFYSKDAGGTWDTLFTAVPGGRNITAIAASPDGVCYVGTDMTGILASSDLETWTQFDPPDWWQSVPRIIALDGGTAFVLRDDGALYRTDDEGQSWNQTGTIPGGGSLQLDRDIDGTMFGTGGGDVYRSTDDGVSWTAFTDGLPEAESPGELKVTHGFVYIGMDSLVYRSPANAAGWIQLGSRLPAKPTAFAQNAEGTPLTGTNRGILRFDASVRVPTVPPFATADLEQNRPNPFKPATQIRYELPSPGDVRLSVHDLLGREVKLLINERKPAGTYQIRFDGSGLPAGIYMYRLLWNDHAISRKMILLK